MNNKVIEYKSYVAQLDFDLDEHIIIGKVINTKDIISFHGETLLDIKQAFKDIIDTYLQACQDENIDPSRVYSGKFNIRIHPDLHRDLSVTASQKGLSLNELTENLIKLGFTHKNELDIKHF